MGTRLPSRRTLGLLCLAAALFCGASSSLVGVCGPFTDVAADSFCPFVLEIFTLGITTGTTPTTYDPAGNVSRLQMAAFLSRSVDGVLKRGSRRAALDQFWTPQTPATLAVTTLFDPPQLLKSDGTDVWAAAGGFIYRVHGSDGKVLDVWEGADNAYAVMAAIGKIFIAADTLPGSLYRIDPGQPAGFVTTLSTSLGNGSTGITFDGAKIWTANFSGQSVSLVTPADTIPWAVSTVTTGFSLPTGLLYDGANVWATNLGDGKLLKLDSTGTILQTVTVGGAPANPVFDGSNIWVPNSNSDSLSVVRASSGAVLATLTGNGLDLPITASFDGQRILVTNFAGNSVSLFKAADLSPAGFVPTGASSKPIGACSDGINFWITLQGANRVVRF